MKKFSIVVPVYFNESNLPATLTRLLELRASLTTYAVELVFVDDGSEDDSLKILLEYQSRVPGAIKVAKLTRNFGAMAAVQAGLTLASGDCVGVITADLQDPPELFTEMLAHWERGIKAVFAIRAHREESVVRRLFSNAYYLLLRRLAISNYPRGGFDFFLIDRRVADEVNAIREKNTNLMSLIFWLGHQYVTIPYTRSARKASKSRWTLSKKIKLFVDSFVAFSYLPIRFLSVVGLLVATAAFIYGVVVAWIWFRSGVEVRGWTPIVLMLALTAGLQMTMLGVLGEYLWRALDEVRRRPSYVIEDLYQ